MNTHRIMKKCMLFILLLAAAAGVSAETTHPIDVQVRITPGRAYSHTKWFAVIPVKLTPQIACWIEEADGTFVAPIYVTEKAASGSWSGGEDVARPEALPVFFHASGWGDTANDAAGGAAGTTADDTAGDASKDAAGGADAVSGATPKKGNTTAASLSRSLQLKPGAYRVVAEFNSSFDYNEDYPKKDGDVNGQPSVVYAAEFRIGEDGRIPDTELRLGLKGHGDPSGRSGAVTAGIGSLTTALEQVEEITVRLIK